MPSTFNPIDPRTGAPGRAYTASTSADVDQAVQLARQSLCSPAFSNPVLRARALNGAAARLRRRADEIVATAETETGLPQVPRLRGELERTCMQLELHAVACAAGDHLDSVIDRADLNAAPAPRPDLRRYNVPIGVVAVFGASNFPLAFGAAGGDTASALAAGCPVIVKGHPLHPSTGTLVANELQAAITDAGLPPGTFSHLLTADHSVGETLVDHPGIDAVAFTGSTSGGRALTERATKRPRPIPVFAEMSSVNPVVISPGALAARTNAIADAVTASVCSSGGQLCTKPGVVFAPDESFADALERRFAERGSEVLLSAEIARAFAEGVRSTLDGDTRARPVILRNSAAGLARDERARKEYFGPAVVVATYESTADLLEALDALGGQLTATLLAEDDEILELQPVVDRLVASAGRVLFDGMPTGVTVTWAMHHGGPFPATSDAAHTSVGQYAARRFVRPVTFQSAPAAVLPPALQDGNPLGLLRRVDGTLTRD